MARTTSFFEPTTMDYRISLRAWHRTLSLEALVQMLALGQPRIGRSVGQERVTRDGRVLGVNRETFCTYEVLSCRDGALEAGLEQLISLMEERRLTIQGIVLDGGVEIYVGIFLEGADSAGFTVCPALSEKLARIGVSATFEIYS